MKAEERKALVEILAAVATAAVYAYALEPSMRERMDSWWLRVRQWVRTGRVPLTVEPSAPEVSAVLQEAERIVRDEA